VLYNVYASLTIERECSFAVGHRHIIYIIIIIMLRAATTGLPRMMCFTLVVHL
jgi:hypothetical protein